MLTRNDRQESLCKAYVRAIAALAGVICAEPDLDYGVDLCLRGVRRRGSRHLDAGGQIDLQLKSTNLVFIQDDTVKYDLEVTAYNDLRQDTDNCPRILVLLVVPDDEAEWLEQSPDQLVLRRCAYWVSLLRSPPSKSKRTVRISIPCGNVFSVAALTQLLNEQSGKDDKP